MKKTVDKFGRYRGYAGEMGPPGIGFVLNSEGNFNLQGKILTNVKNHIDKQDVVTINYLENTLKRTVQYDEGDEAYKCKSCRISDVKSPEKETDAVTLQYLKEKTLHRIVGDDFSAGNKLIKNVGMAIDKNDVVSVSYVQEKVVPDILTVKNPILDTDAVNLRYLRSSTISDNGNGQFDAIDRCIKNVAPPLEKRDAVNLSYLDDTVNSRIARTTIVSGKERNVWDVRNKNLRFVNDAEYGSDSVNFRTLKRLLKMQAYFVNKEIADVGIHLRRELYDFFVNPPSNDIIQSRIKLMNDIKTDHKRTWRSALGSSDEAKFVYKPDERKQISRFLEIDEKYVNRYLDVEK